MEFELGLENLIKKVFQSFKVFIYILEELLLIHLTDFMYKVRKKLKAMIYLALLRGINLGHNKRIKMVDLEVENEKFEIRGGEVYLYCPNRYRMTKLKSDLLKRS